MHRRSKINVIGRTKICYTWRGGGEGGGSAATKDGIRIIFVLSFFSPSPSFSSSFIIFLSKFLVGQMPVCPKGATLLWCVNSSVK